MKSAIIMLLFLTCGSALQGQTTIVLQPGPEDGKDGMVWDDPIYSKAKRNYANSTEMLVHAWTDQGVPVYARSYLAFDLTSIQRTDLINATLVLHNNPEGTFNGEHQPWSGPNRAWVRRVTTPWDETELTWYNQPASTEEHQVLVPESVDPHQSYFLNVTPLVTEMLGIHRYDSHGFMIILENETHYRALVFATSNYADPARRPRLELTFSSQTPVNALTHFAAINMEIYPNPATDRVEVQVDLPTGKTGHVELLNVLGQVLQSRRIHESTRLHLSLEGLSQGQYWLRLGTTDDVVIKPIIVR
ncbi:MAG: T9SS type A sorting domain-containing protein [Bacteroidetes bacterium]|nr:T9SS type A sorting domain-containing protein [Bacteroidota bacterium]